MIRGPGAALWGSNAVNGVINITTRSARDTHGIYAEAGAGTFDRALAGRALWRRNRRRRELPRVRQVSRSRRNHASRHRPTDDAWSLAHIGFRTDWDGGRATPSPSRAMPTPANRVSWCPPSPSSAGPARRPAQCGRERRQPAGALAPQPRAILGHAAARLLRLHQSRRPELSKTRCTPSTSIFSSRFTAFARHEIIWGAAYRLTANHNEPG